MERYRSGHNGAVLKTVSLKGHGGSSPSASAKCEQCNLLRKVVLFLFLMFY